MKSVESTSQIIMSRIELFAQQTGFVFKTTCPVDDDKLRRTLVMHFQQQCAANPGSEFFIWSDGSIFRFWLLDTKKTMRPTVPSLTSESSAGTDTGATIRSSPPDAESEGIPSLIPSPPNPGGDAIDGSRKLAIAPPPPIDEEHH